MDSKKNNIIGYDLKQYLSKRIIPVKYAYILSAAEFHSKFAESIDYQSNVEIDMMKYSFLLQFINTNDYTYCEIGGDDGRLSLNIIKYLFNEGIKFRRYCFIDFSQELLKKCKQNFLASLPNETSQFIQYDMEKENTIIPIQTDSKKIIFFLGNTLGNVESEDIVLKNIFNSMGNNDLLLIGLTFENNFDELGNYNNDLFRESVLEFLRIIGIEINHENYILRYDKNERKVICEYRLGKRFVFENIEFNEGEIIRCFQSRRYNRNSYECLFHKNGFKIIAKEVDKNSRHVLLLMKKSDK